ncbi:MAG: universal stress protein, partial [Myxococcales bacterium]|nr:universal stress protein [Myxococcales bacterium]
MTQRKSSVGDRSSEVAAAPVELLSKEPSGSLTKVLIPIDLSDAAERAVRWVLKQPGKATKTLRVVLWREAGDGDAADLLRFLGRFGEQRHALIHGQVFTGDERQLCTMIRTEEIEKIVVGVGDDAESETGALAQSLARLCSCGVILVPRREPVR